MSADRVAGETHASELSVIERARPTTVSMGSPGLSGNLILSPTTRGEFAALRTTSPGAVAHSDQSVALIVKRHAHAAGVSPAAVSAHSLRAGYATAAAAAGVEERKIANVTRHENLPVVLRRCIRAATAFDDVGEVL